MTLNWEDMTPEMRRLRARQHMGSPPEECVRIIKPAPEKNTEETMGNSFDLFMQNPYWKAIYDGAPSEYLKEYYRLMFEYKSFASEEPVPDEVIERLKELWLDKADILYLLEHAGIAQAKIHYGKCLQAIDDDSDATCVAAISCMGEIRNPWFEPEGKDKK